MTAARNDRTIRDVGQNVVIGDKHFEVVKEFVYLGSLMTPTNDVSLEIQRRIQTANKCLFGLRKHLLSSHLSHQTKFTMRHGCWPKGRRTNCSYLRGRFSERYAAGKSKMVSTGEGQPRTRLRIWQPKCPKFHEDQQIALSWSHDQKTWKPKSDIQSQTQWKEKSRMGWTAIVWL
jgi:hypothetical protein